MKPVVILLILALCVLHHDVWWWDTPQPIAPNATAAERSQGLVFGFMPIGLAWHTMISFGAGLVWFLAVRFCWPTGLDEEGAQA